MTRKEIINEINCLLSELDNGDDAVSYLTQNDVNWLKENIKALEQEQKWIPVTERLPEDGQYVIVSFSCDAFDLSHKRVMTAWYNKKYGFTCGITDAWMPLPEPYRTEREVE